MMLSKKLEEALKIPTPYDMHVKHGMVLSPEFITKGRKAAEAKGARLFLFHDENGWRIEAKIIGRGVIRRNFERKKDAQNLARRIVGQLRDYGDDFVVNDGSRTWRVKAGDTLAAAAAIKAVATFFKRGGP
jgi:hypothetical protein